MSQFRPHWVVSLYVMQLLRSIMLSIVASLVLLAVPDTMLAQAEAASLQKKASEAQARIHANKDDRDELKRAVKTNEVDVAKQVLLRNGFTAEDL